MRIKTWNFRTTIYGVRSIAFLTSLSAHCALDAIPGHNDTDNDVTVFKAMMTFVLTTENVFSKELTNRARGEDVTGSEIENDKRAQISAEFRLAANSLRHIWRLQVIFGPNFWIFSVEYDCAEHHITSISQSGNDLI